MEDIRKTWLIESINQGSHGLTDSNGKHGVCMCLHLLWLLVWCFLRLLTVGAGVSLIFLPALGTLFLLLGCFVQPRYEGFCLVALYLVLSCLAVVSCRPDLFWRGNGRGVDLGREEVVQKSYKKWRKGKLWLGYIVWERNLFSIKIWKKEANLFPWQGIYGMHRKSQSHNIFDLAPGS